ncbi:MAG: hypothetical protein IPP48_11375 [Chitinophagaceae bacterium]|nr:hypothetical protein [Chitinophagaceae bacterium]
MRFFIVFLFVIYNSISFAQVNINAGLISYHPFSGNANDISGNNIHGTVTGATLTTDRNGAPNSAYYFNGFSYIQLPFQIYIILPHKILFINICMGAA